MNPSFRFFPKSPTTSSKSGASSPRMTSGRLTESKSEIWDAFAELAKFPEMGHERPALASPALRFWVVRAYLIAHAPDERPLLIVAVLHGKRNPRLLAAILKERKTG